MSTYICRYHGYHNADGYGDYVANPSLSSLSGGGHHGPTYIGHDFMRRYAVLLLLSNVDGPSQHVEYDDVGRSFGMR
jgi:hypothetical protein